MNREFCKLSVFYVLIIFSWIGFCFQIRAFDVVGAEKVRHATITVNTSKKIGKLPYLFRAGSFLWYLPEPESIRAFDKFLSEHRVGTVAIKLDTVLEPSKNYGDFVKRLSIWDSTVKKIVAHGGEVVFEIWSMPLWLTKNPSRRPDLDTFESKNIAFKSPPRDYEEWGRIVFAIVDHFNNGLKIDARYQVWAEPDIHWLGSEGEYLKLYKYSVKGARRADAKARIGGPATTGWDARSLRVKSDLSDKSMIYNLIRYCSETSIPELGLSRLPIDFIVWHQYNMSPFSPSAFARPVKVIREWLKEFDFKEKTELLIGEWNSWQEIGKEHPYFSAEHDTEFTASYIIAILDAMHRHGIDRHVFSTLFEFGSPDREFVGNFGMFTKRKIIKPAYNAFRLISMLGPDLIETEVDDDFIVAIGTREGGNIALLISNFFPDGKMLQGAVFSRKATELPEIEHQYDPEEVKRAGLTKELLRKLLTEEISVDDVNIPAQTKKDIRILISYMHKYQRNAQYEKWRTRNPIRIQINFKGLFYEEKFQYQRYLIDSRHSNSYAVRAKVESALKQGKEAEVVNEWPEVRLEPVELKMVKPSQDYTINFAMEPYSVTLIMLSK